MRIYRRELLAAFDHFARAMKEAGYPTDGLELTGWAPGDGVRRYRVEHKGQPVFGSLYWLGKANAWAALHFAAHALDMVARADAGTLPEWLANNHGIGGK